MERCRKKVLRELCSRVSEPGGCRTRLTPAPSLVYNWCRPVSVLACRGEAAWHQPFWPGPEQGWTGPVTSQSKNALSKHLALVPTAVQGDGGAFCILYSQLVGHVRHLTYRQLGLLSDAVSLALKFRDWRGTGAWLPCQGDLGN